MSEQNETEYRPTNGELKLLDVLLNPEMRNKSVTDICATAGISRQTYYRAFEKPQFVAHYEERAKDLVHAAVGPVVNAFVKAAKDGSYPHGKVILEMAGFYAESRKVEHLGEGGGPFRIVVEVLDENEET